MRKVPLPPPFIPVIKCCDCGAALDHVYGFHDRGVYCVSCAPVGTIFFGDPTLEVKIDFTGTSYRLVRLSLMVGGGL